MIIKQDHHGAAYQEVEKLCPRVTLCPKDLEFCGHSHVSLVGFKHDPHILNCKPDLPNSNNSSEHPSQNYKTHLFLCAYLLARQRSNETGSTNIALHTTTLPSPNILLTLILRIQLS